MIKPITLVLFNDSNSKTSIPIYFHFSIKKDHQHHHFSLVNIVTLESALRQICWPHLSRILPKISNSIVLIELMWANIDGFGVSSWKPIITLRWHHATRHIAKISIIECHFVCNVYL